MNYVLVSTIERDICVPTLFKTWEEAHDQMCFEFAESLGIEKEAAKELYLSGEEDGSGFCVLEDSAWSEHHGNNFDWKIFKFENGEFS